MVVVNDIITLMVSDAWLCHNCRPLYKQLVGVVKVVVMTMTVLYNSVASDVHCDVTKFNHNTNNVSSCNMIIMAS